MCHPAFPSMQRGLCHLSSPRCHHRAHRLGLKHNYPIPVCFGRNRICFGARGCAQCHPGWWQHPAAADRSEMSLRIGLQMIKYTIALDLAIKIFAVAGREKQCFSKGRSPALNPKAFPHCAQEQILSVTSHLQSTSEGSQSPSLSYLGQWKAPTALDVWFIWFQTTSWNLFPLSQLLTHTLHQ